MLVVQAPIQVILLNSEQRTPARVAHERGSTVVWSDGSVKYCFLESVHCESVCVMMFMSLFNFVIDWESSFPKLRG